MTVHSAKGLEFKNVFVVGMEENLFPSSMVGDSPRALEEERRLFYVAITRAEEHCFLSYAKTRFRYGKMEFGSPSRFLKDIDVRFLRLPQDAGMFRRVEEEAAVSAGRTPEALRLIGKMLRMEEKSVCLYGRSSRLLRRPFHVT